MNWIDSIKKIREAQENNQLIVFVGAGVSHNSGIPTWWELIKKIAEKIGYDKCNSSQKEKELVPKRNVRNVMNLRRMSFFGSRSIFIRQMHQRIIPSIMNCSKIR